MPGKIHELKGLKELNVLINKKNDGDFCCFIIG